MNINDHPQNFRFNHENAREMAARSWDARRLRKSKLEGEAAAGRQATPQSERLAQIIARVERMIEETKDADKLQKLSATHARLFNAWQVLTATPNPGSRRVKRGQSSPYFTPAVPVDFMGSGPIEVPPVAGNIPAS